MALSPPALVKRPRCAVVESWLTPEAAQSPERLACGVDDDLSGRALEALSAEEYMLGHLDKPDLWRMRGL
jgi:hypothetical protein